MCSCDTCEIPDGIDDGGRVVIDARGFFSYMGTTSTFVFLGEPLQSLGRRAIRDTLGRFIPFDLLFTAKIRAVKDFLHAFTCTPFSPLLDQLHVLLDHPVDL